MRIWRKKNIHKYIWKRVVHNRLPWHATNLSVLRSVEAKSRISIQLAYRDELLLTKTTSKEATDGMLRTAHLSPPSVSTCHCMVWRSINQPPGAHRRPPDSRSKTRDFILLLMGKGWWAVKSCQLRTPPPTGLEERLRKEKTKRTETQVHLPKAKLGNLIACCDGMLINM